MADKAIPSQQPGIRSDGAGTANRSARSFAADPFVEKRPRKRARSAVERGDRYSFFVFIMKFILPGLAIVTLAIALLWPTLNQAQKTIRDSAKIKVSPDQIKNFEMLAPKLVGTDKDNRPFRISAKSARQASAKADSVTLIEPKANMTLEKGRWVALSAKRGVYSQKKKTLHLSGNVNLYHDANYTFKTEDAIVDMNGRNAWGNKPVSGSGPSATIHAQGFRTYDRGGRVVFTGKSRVVLYLGKNNLGNIFNAPSKTARPDKPEKNTD